VTNGWILALHERPQPLGGESEPRSEHHVGRRPPPRRLFRDNCADRRVAAVGVEEQESAEAVRDRGV
jgi:hypothetical protein